MSNVQCAECGVIVDIDDAEAGYNAELDEVFFYCSKCINDPDYLPVDEFAETELSNDELDEEIEC